MSKQKLLLKKIKEKKARIAVIGLGYVGLPLAILFAKSGFVVNGYARNEKKIKLLASGTSNIGVDDDLRKVIRSKNFSVNSITSKKLDENDIYIICVPTPVNKNKRPDLSSLKQVATRLSKMNLDNKLIINESTVAPLTTRRILGSLAGTYFLVCSPERIDPGGNKTVENITKVIGAINAESLELGCTLYKGILKKELVIVKSMEIAEMSKMLENTYRAINIALINEFALLTEKLDIDILRVIAAAKTKWSFQAHYPGLGVGGHCIPVDPYYLLKLANDKKIKMPVVSEGLLQNDQMPHNFVKKILKNYRKNMSVLIYGLTYKKDVADLRESPVLVLCKLLQRKKIDFTVYDPLLKDNLIKELGLAVGNLEQVDMFIVGTDHKELAVDYQRAVGRETVIIDGRNFFLNKIGKKVIGVGRKLE